MNLGNEHLRCIWGEGRKERRREGGREGGKGRDLQASSANGRFGRSLEKSKLHYFGIVQ